MDADEIVIHEVERQRVAVVLKLLRKGIRQPREPAHGHAHREVLALGIRRADVLCVGLADLGVFLMPVHSAGL